MNIFQKRGNVDIQKHVCHLEERHCFPHSHKQCYVNVKSMSKTVTGLLSSVSDLRAEGSSDSITISWSAPFSLLPDIWYSVLISNVTDENHPTAVPCTYCHSLTQTHYTFNPALPSPCHKYTFTVIPQNGVGQGESSQPVVGYTGIIICVVYIILVSQWFHWSHVITSPFMAICYPI